MPLVVNLRHLDAHDVRLKGALSIEELDIDTRDEVIQMTHPLEHDFEVHQLENGLLLQGRLSLKLECQCVRCLKPFQLQLDLNPWQCFLPLQGEESAPVVNDCVDLTPYVREDILLEFPRHPLCNLECRGLPRASVGSTKAASSSGKSEMNSSAWAELNKLRF